MQLTVDMKRNVLHLLCFVAVLASVAFFPETAADSLMPTVYTFQPSTTFNPIGTPCDGKTCPAGKYCAVDENNKTSCVCDVSCDSSYNPVCGSDNRTYSSSCALRLEACLNNPNLTILYYRSCQDEGTVCAGVTCPLNRECAVDDKHRATCVCIQSCLNYANPVCGSNNKTYINQCELDRQSCLQNSSVTNAYYGECNQETVCDEVKCPTGTECAVNESNRPVCVCANRCPYSKNTVCGSDGRTYGSKCELKREACSTGKDIRVAHKGFCLQGTVCSGHQCPSGKQCTVDEFNHPDCVCVEWCPFDYDPVCGRDGRTYNNLCVLEREACTTRTNLTMERNRPCTYDEFCYGVECPGLMSCVVDGQNQTSCVCEERCGDLYEPVCGFDNRTYDNHCQMEAAACKANTTITYHYFGVCSEGSNCQGHYCPRGTHCDSKNRPEQPICVCNEVCPKYYDPICGSNNRTYNNTCELQRDGCLTNTSITIQFTGRCDEGPGCYLKSCPYGQVCEVGPLNQPFCVCSLKTCYAGKQEVCGTDNKTYSNDCFLTVTACMTKKNISIQYYGRCTEESPCSGVVCSSDRNCKLDENGRPTCVCNDECSSIGYPVCGNNNRTYANYCELRKNSCLTNTSILLLHYGSCVEDSVCDGLSCPPERRCAVDEQNRPICVCVEDCLSVEYPVCGSDERTYMNECEMQKKACLTGRNITLVHRGDCNQGLKCSDINCRDGRNCAMNQANQLTCVCNTHCSSYFYNPVCGTDGKTYSNQCELLREACTTDSNIEEAYSHPCKNDAKSSSSLAVSARSSTTKGGCIGSLCKSSTTTTTTTMPLSRNH